MTNGFTVLNPGGQYIRPVSTYSQRDVIHYIILTYSFIISLRSKKEVSSYGDRKPIVFKVRVLGLDCLPRNPKVQDG